MQAYFLELVRNLDVTVNGAFWALAVILARFPELRTKRYWVAFGILLALVNAIPSNPVMEGFLK